MNLGTLYKDSRYPGISFFILEGIVLLGVGIVLVIGGIWSDIFLFSGFLCLILGLGTVLAGLFLHILTDIWNKNRYR